MKTQGKVLVLLLSIALLFGQLPIQAFAQGRTVSGGDSQEAQPEQAVSGGDGQEAQPGQAAGGNGQETQPGQPGQGGEGQTLSGGADMPALFASGRADGTPEVTRLEWLKALTETFQMSVTEDNYPDNYYTDITADSEDYYDVMLATEFGLVDVEAGEALRPDEAATREFAAHSLNQCMGYQLQEGAEYTFSEAAEVTYPQDIQVAVDQGWMALSGGSFLPERGITQAEKDKMIGIAAEAVASAAIGDELICDFQLVDGVKVIPEGIEAELTGENELTLYDGAAEIAEGDLFVIVADGFPMAYKAEGVTRTDDTTVISVGEVDADQVFVSLETQGSMQGDLAKAQAADDSVQLAYIVGGTAAQDYEDGITYYSLDEVGEQEITAVVATKQIEVTEEGIAAYSDDPGELDMTKIVSVSCKVSKPDLDWDVSILKQKVYMKVSADVSVSANISTPNIVDLGLEDFFAKIPIGIVGYVKPSMEGSVKGTLSLGCRGKIAGGIEWTAKHGWRPIKEFNKQAFTIQSSVEAKLGAKFAIGVDLKVIKAELSVSGGGKASYQVTTYTDNKQPFECKHLTAHLYASFNGTASINVLFFKGSYDFLTIPIFTEKNSPVKVALHYEDGQPVKECTRDKEETGSGSGSGSGSGTAGKKYKYYTPIDSQYAYSGINSGTSSSGKPYTVFEYSLDKDNRATITKYNGNVAALNIPATIDGYTVVGIGQDVFKNNSRIQVVTMPDTVTEIGKWAFLNCSNLSEVVLPKNLVKIGGAAFKDCGSLTSITIPKSLQETTETGGFGSVYGVFTGVSNLKAVSFEEGIAEIPMGLFANNISIEEITIPDTVTAIGKNAFEKCTGLRAVKLGTGLHTIRDYAFLGCGSLQEIDIPDTVTMIGSYAFKDCGNLKRVKLGEGLTYIATEAFRNAKALTEIQIPDSVIQIGAGAFLGCSNLADVSLSKNLTKMGGYAFGDCGSLTGITIPKSLQETTKEYYYEYIYDYHYGVFIASDNLKTIRFEEGVTEIPIGLFANNNSIEEIIIPHTVTVIENNAFEECRGLKKVKLSEGLTVIEQDAFSNVKGLTEIQIPDSVTQIGAGAFLGCSNLATVSLSKNLTKMGGYAFGDCDSLTSITIPKSLKKTTAEYYYKYLYDYHYGVFIASDNLKTIDFEEGVTEIPEGLFANNSSIEEITVPDTVKEIGLKAFEKCTALKKIKLSSKLEGISSDAFQGCTSLQEIDIPDTVTGMGFRIFEGCSSLARVKWPNSYAAILEGTFRDCSSLKEITLPEKVNTIQNNAFRGSGLTKITLPENVTQIGNNAFRDCSALAEVKMGGKVASIGNDCFSNCDALKGIALPDSVTSLGTYCFADCEVLKEVKLGSGLTKIPSYCFNLCPALEEIVLPYRLTTVESSAFTNCTKLTKLTVPRAVTSIKSNAFSYPGKMTVYGVPGTYAEEWAKSAGAAFVAQEKPVTAVVLSEKEVTVNKGVTKALVVTVTPADFTDELSWKSSNTSVATVSDTGVVTATGVGTAVIQVNAGRLSASCKVTVLQPVTAIYLSSSNRPMEAGDTYTLTATVYPNNANNKTVAWASSDETVASVDTAGKVTALKKGSAVITATANDGSGVSRSCTVTVINNLYQCTTTAALESPHNYENKCSDAWIYTLPGAARISVTFDERTEVEDGFDYIYLYDASGEEVGRYTGKSLAGKTVTLDGDTVKIKLVTDKAGDAWGFKVTKAEAAQASYTLSGTVKCYSNEIEELTSFRLKDSKGDIVAGGNVPGGYSSRYTLNAYPGTYTLIVSRDDHAVREYDITVTDQNIKLDVELRLLGDVNGDGVISGRDKKLLYNHMEKVSELSGYLFKVGDVNGDGVISGRDKKLLYNHMEKVSLLW